MKIPLSLALLSQLFSFLNPFSLSTEQNHSVKLEFVVLHIAALKLSHKPPMAFSSWSISSTLLWNLNLNPCRLRPSSRQPISLPILSRNWYPLAQIRGSHGSVWFVWRISIPLAITSSMASSVSSRLDSQVTSVYIYNESFDAQVEPENIFLLWCPSKFSPRSLRDADPISYNHLNPQLSIAYEVRLIQPFGISWAVWETVNDFGL